MAKYVVDGVTVERFGAQIVFRQVDDSPLRESEGTWQGTLLSLEARDRQAYDELAVDEHGQRRYKCRIIHARYMGRMQYELLTSGPSESGRRYRYFDTLTEAQEAAIKWAARRFYIEIRTA